MMLPFGELLLKLAALVPVSGELTVREMELTLPIESRIGHGGELRASLPRGRLATGFDPPLTQMALRFEVQS
jgi:hypothetical protein